MDQPSVKKKSSVVRVFILSFVIFALFGGAIFGWYFLADIVEAALNKEKQRLARDGKIVTCANQQIRGFPFRVGVFCDDVEYEDSQANLRFEAGAFRSAAQFYNPGFVVGELDSPAQIDLPDLGAVDLDWKLIRTSTKITLDGVRRISVGISEPFIKGKSAGRITLPDIRSSLFEVHLRAAADNVLSADAEAAIKVNDLKISDQSGNGLPVISLDGDSIITGINQAIRSGENLQAWVKANGLELTLRNFNVRIDGGGKIAASGPLSVDRRGLVSGKLDVHIEEFTQLLRMAVQINPQLGETAQLLQQATALLARGNGKKIRLQLQIKGGQISAGIIPLGIIPPLF